MNGIFKPKEKEVGKVVMLELASLRPNKSQPRIEFNDAAIKSLAESIRENGILQPICVRRNGALFEIISGRLSGTYALNETAVLLNSLRNVFGVELHRLIEERERKYKQTQCKHIIKLNVPTGRRTREPLGNSRISGFRTRKTYYHCGERNERERKD